MMNDKILADCQMFKVSLAKAEDMIKALRTEKEYYQRQLDCLRKEVETMR